MIRGLGLGLCLALAACTETVTLSARDPLAGLVSLTIAPGDQTLLLTDLATPPTLEYHATGTFADGVERDVTPFVTWELDNPAPGSFVEPGRFQASARAAGRATVTARGAEVTATATLLIVATITIIDPTFPPPLAADSLFGPGVPVVTGDPNRSPSLLYPSDATVFPQGLSRILLQYRPGQNTDAIRITFDSDVLHLTVLTSADRWQPDSQVWTLISASSPGASTTLVVAGASSAMPGTIYASKAATLSFSGTDPGGMIYLWSAASSGLHHTTLGSPTTTRLYPPAGATSCVGCHVVSRDGTQIALGYGGETLQTLDAATLTTRISADRQYPMGWATFSPDGKLLLIASNGALTLRDAATGAPVGTPDGRVPLAMKATHPDWSPDGRFVAVAVTNDITTNMEVKNGSIARIPFQDGAFGAPEILVKSGMMSNNYFPRWSPDGAFIAYVNAKTSSLGARSAELRLVRAEGGAPIPLRAASHRVAGADVPDLAATMPAWGPPNDDPVMWLAFTSTRPYGAIMPTADRGQIWIAGIDPRRTGDPSSPAFWLPSQDIRVLNNNPIWAVAPTPSTF